MENRSPRNSLLRNKRLLLSILAFAIAGGSSFVLWDWLRLGPHLPEVELQASRRVLDRYGREIRHALSVSGERRYSLPLDQIPELLRKAFVHAEDRHFFEHSGVDWRALARGAYLSVRHLRAVSGGSTIPIQLVRILWPEARGFIHKPAQILQALRLSANYSKGELLTEYLNTVPFGSQLSGVGAGCLYFFGAACGSLSPAQIAALAILPRNPTYLSTHLDALQHRRDALLGTLLSGPDAGADALVTSQARAEPLEIVKQAPDFEAPHLAERVLKERSETVVQTTLDLDLQREIQKLLYNETVGRPGTGDSGAVLVLENKTGEVLGYVGSPDFFEAKHGMVDGAQVLRSPGSAMKPFIYELALENNWNLFNILPDIPILFSTQRAVYEPHNYGGNFSGPRTLREALANSKNLPALYLTSQLGESRVLEHLRRFGLASLTENAAHYGVGLALGNGEVSLWELTQAYATLARQGLFVPSSYYLDRHSSPHRLIPEQTAFLISDVLRDPLAREEEFGRFGPLEFDYEVGVKTGTSTDYKDNWTMGFTRDVTIGVWRGNAASTPLERRLPAARGTGPLFHQVMELVHRFRQPGWVSPPEGVEQSEVCALSGMKPTHLCPLKRLEHHLKGHAPTEPCDFHREIEIADCGTKAGPRLTKIRYVHFPAEYSEWARSPSVPTLENQLQEKCGRRPSLLADAALSTEPAKPRIVEPLDQTVYAVDPSIPSEHQQIRFLLRGITPGHATRVFINDEVQADAGRDSEFYWKLERGRFRFRVQEGEQASNEVTILVR